MKKVVVLIAAIGLLYLQAFAQFPGINLFPMGVIGSPYGDTLLNTRATMEKKGIKKIRVYQTLPGVTKRYLLKTVYLNKDGNIDSLIFCFPGQNNGDSGFCIADKLSYDDQGRLVEFKENNAKGLILRIMADYISKAEVKNTFIASLDAGTSTEYKFFNEKGQMVKLTQIRKALAINTYLYYNQDGLLDSVKQETPDLNTFIFTRSEKRKNILIQMENTRAAFIWIYNRSRQCMNTTYAIKNPFYSSTRPGSKYTQKTEIDYYYNTDGALLKVTEKRSDKPTVSMFYSYSK